MLELEEKDADRPENLHGIGARQAAAAVSRLDCSFVAKVFCLLTTSVALYIEELVTTDNSLDLGIQDTILFMHRI